MQTEGRMAITTTDTIEKRIILHAPLRRVWRAISDSAEFGTWFGVTFEGPFVAGAPLRGRITGTKVDPQVAELQKPHVGKAFNIVVEQIEPERLFSFRWHPYAIEPGTDYSTEPTTLVTFRLEETAEGVQLTLTESGFDQIPLERRAKAFAANEGGWSHQMALISRYLENGSQAH
jgi:uncharacterized protein YndB with AHSA1/START domain